MDGLPDVERLIEEEFDGEICGQPDEFWKAFFDAVHHSDRIGAGLLENRQVHGPLAVHADDIALNHRGIDRFPHVAETNRDAVLHLDRDLVHAIDNLDQTVRVDVVIEVADLHVAGRQQEALLVDGGDDLLGRNASRQHAFAIEKDGDLADRASKTRRHENTGDGGELRTDVVIGLVPNVLFAEPLAAGRQHADGKTRHAELDNNGRKHSGGKVLER